MSFEEIQQNKYPKLQTLFKRDMGNIIEDNVSCPEFDAVKTWIVTEKINGTNIRVCYDPNTEQISIKGRTEESALNLVAFKYLTETFIPDRFGRVLDKLEGNLPIITIFGELVGEKIQKTQYTKNYHFVVFDVVIGGHWLEYHNVMDVAEKMGLTYANCIFNVPISKEKIIRYVKSEPDSILNPKRLMEGIVARSYPLMLFKKNSYPIMFKLKRRDFYGKSKRKAKQKCKCGHPLTFLDTDEAQSYKCAQCGKEYCKLIKPKKGGA